MLDGMEKIDSALQMESIYVDLFRLQIAALQVLRSLFSESKIVYIDRSIDRLLFLLLLLP